MESSASESLFEIESINSNDDENNSNNPAIPISRSSPLAIALNQVLVEAAADEASAAAAMRKKKKASKAAAKYVVKLAANANNAAAGNQASTELIYKLKSVCNTIARCLKMGIGKDFSDDMCNEGAHALICSLMRRPSLANSIEVQTACCHALANLISLTEIDTPARFEMQKEFVEINCHVAVSSALANVVLRCNRDCVCEAIRLCSLMAEKNKNVAKRLRKCGAVASVQNILMEQSINDKITKVVVMFPAKICLQDLWYGNKKKRGKGDAP